MKKILVIAVIQLSINSYSQDTTFFVTDSKDIVWKKVFTTSLTFNELLLQVKKTGLFSNIDTSSNLILGELKRTPIDYSNGKETIWKSDIPIYIKLSDITATFEINYKAGKYQVIIKNIKCIGKTDNPTNSLFLKPNEVELLSFYALKNSKPEFNKNFIKSSVPIFDFTFNKFFSLKDMNNNNW
jgi:hypothetical protein